MRYADEMGKSGDEGERREGEIWDRTEGFGAVDVMDLHGIGVEGWDVGQS